LRHIKTLTDFRLTLRQFFHFSEEAASRLGVSSQQYQVMLAIRAASESRITVGALAEHMFLKPHSVTGLLNRLVKLGFVQRARRTHDRREVSVTLTPNGLEILEALAAAHRSELRRLKPMLNEILSRL